jgi:hypothetical protein
MTLFLQRIGAMALAMVFCLAVGGLWMLAVDFVQYVIYRVL